MTTSLAIGLVRELTLHIPRARIPITLLLLSTWLIPAVGPMEAAAGPDAFVQNRKIGRSVNVLGYDPIWRSFDQARFQARHFQGINKPMEFTHQGAAWSEHKDKLGVPWQGTPEEQAAANRDFAKVQAWASQHRRPILLGEFGAYDKAEMSSRQRYTAFVARAAEQLGWSWAYWQFDSDFIVYDISKDQWVDAIHRALIPATGAVQPKSR